MQKETANQTSFSILKKFKIVIIEDDEGLNLLLNKKLRRAGFQTKSIFTGNEALSSIEADTNQILLVDYKLPDMTGKELIEKLYLNFHKLPYFFIMTGFGDEKIAVDMMKLSARDYIVKDANFIDVLIEKLKHTCLVIEEQNKLTETELALKASELNYQNLYEKMSQGVVYQDKEGKIISANAAAQRILGLKYSEIIGATSMDPAWRAVDENKIDLPGERHAAMIALSTGKAVENFLMGVYNPQIKDYVWIIVNSIPQFKEGEPEPFRVFSTFTDVTKRINAEEELKAINQQLSANEQQLRATNQQLIANEQQLLAANQQLKAAEKQLKETNINLRESEKQFRELFENLEQGFALHEMIYDENKNPVDYRFVLINRAFEKLTGTNALDYIGKTVKQVLPEIEQVWIDNYGKVAKTGKPLHFEHYSNIFNKHYDVIAYSPKKNFFATVFTDITDEKLHQEQILEAKSRAERNEQDLNLLFDNMHQGFALHKMIYNKSEEPTGFKFIRVSPAFEKITQRNISAHIGKNIFDVYPDTSKKWLSVFNSIAQTGKEKQFEYFDKKIKKYYLINAFRPKQKYFAVLITDITSIKEYEKELIAAKEKAEEGDRLKSAFLANMSHEIRTPMNGILGFTDLLKEPDLTSEEMAKYIEIIQKSGNRMLSTINDLIDISRIETGQVELFLKNIDIINEFEDHVSFFIAEAKKKGLQLKFINKLSDKERFFRTDQQKFNSILINLVKNAIKYTDNGSIEICISKRNGNFQCYIKDTGIGVPKNRQQAIFDRFVQADVDDSRAFQGSGLGLSITKAYIEMLGGILSLDSEPGVGSTFTFILPKITEHEETIDHQKIEPSTETEEASKKLKILVAEDDEINFKHLSIVLTDYAAEVIHATNGLDAITLCKNNPDIDLIFMDIRMPAADGYEATEKIRTFNKEIIIIAQTAYALEGDREKALDAGCNDYISKPFGKSKIIDLINKYF